MTFFFACVATYLWWRFIFVSTFKSGRYFIMSGITEWPYHIIGMIGWCLLIFVAVDCFLEKIIDEKRIFEGEGGID